MNSVDYEIQRAAIESDLTKDETSNMTAASNPLKSVLVGTGLMLLSFFAVWRKWLMLY